MAIHQWMGRHIVDASHHADLEKDSAGYEFGATKLGRKEAEEAAYEAYKRKHHGAAIAHHAHAMRAAMGQGDSEGAERHSTLYRLHMKSLGLKTGSTPPPEAIEPKDHEEYHKFKPHHADQLLVAHSMSKSDRHDYFKSIDDADGGAGLFLSEPDMDPDLSKSLKSPMALEQLHGQKVKVYFNLHNRLFSVQHGGRVVAHLPEVALKNVKFKVSEAGRQRVLREQRKNVHAFVEGEFEHKQTGEHKTLPQGVSYNPYKHSSFVRTHDKSPIHEAPSASLKNLPHPMITVEEKNVPESDPSFIHKRGQTE